MYRLARTRTQGKKKSLGGTFDVVVGNSLPRVAVVGGTGTGAGGSGCYGNGRFFFTLNDHHRSLLSSSSLSLSSSFLRLNSGRSAGLRGIYRMFSRRLSSNGSGSGSVGVGVGNNSYQALHDNNCWTHTRVYPEVGFNSAIQQRQQGGFLTLTLHKYRQVIQQYILKLESSGFENFRKKSSSPQNPSSKQSSNSNTNTNTNTNSNAKGEQQNSNSGSSETKQHTPNSTNNNSKNSHNNSSHESIESSSKKSNESSKKSSEYESTSKKDKTVGHKETKTTGGSGQHNNNNGFFSGNDAWLGALLILPLCWLVFGPNWSYKINQNQISFQQFKVHMLEAGIVDHIEVINKEIARVYLKPLNTTSTSADEAYDGRRKGSYGQYSPDKVYEFHIGTVASFEDKLSIAQEDMDLPPTEWVPVSYVDEINVKDRILELVTSSPVMTLLVFWIIIRMFRKSSEGLMKAPFGRNSNLFDVTRANAKVINKGEKVKTKFSDVAGLDTAKEEVMEFVRFLKNPEQYTKLGAHIPKGALLVGPPGTGKTLLARAVAGEADCAFFSITGSDFVEMFVGVGPSRVRNLFEEARKNAPCIVFIDEIDAVGRKRGKGGWAGSNDERENTLNQLLVEMDGFKTDTNVIVLAGTNRADILDTALTRPGRFDRQIQIEKPDIKGRIEIFKVHCKKIKLENPIEDVAQRMATLTPGFSGADIANIVNEAAIRAARKNKERVGMVDFYEANDRVIGGLEKRIVMSAHEKKLVAHHEAGHAVAGWFLEHAEPLLKVTVIPRASGALGFAQYLPKELQLYSAAQLYHMMCMALGGRAAEQIFFNKVSTGAADDLNKVTKLAYAQIAIYGMNEKIGNLSFPPEQNDGIHAYRPYSEKTAEIMDQEAYTMVDKAFKDTLQLLTDKKELVEKLARRLMEMETLGHEELVQVLGERPFQNDAYKDYLANTKDFAAKYGTENELQAKEKEKEIQKQQQQQEAEKLQQQKEKEKEKETKAKEL